MKITSHRILYSMVALLLIILYSCEEFLDKKPLSRYTIPETPEDCQRLLDDYGKMNQGYPPNGEASADNYYLTADSWNALSNVEDRNMYRWNSQTQHSHLTWLNPYKVVYNANLVLETLAKIPQAQDELRGSALFFRAYGHFQVAQLFCQPYRESSAAVDPGIPLWLNAASDNVSRRGTVQQTYEQIMNDLEAACGLLPTDVVVPSRPGRAAAHGLLARVYLFMQRYGEALDEAKHCLEIQSELLDYNELDANANVPFKRFNKEVIFQSVFSSSPVFGSGVMRVDTNLLGSYAPDDLRRKLFFRSNTDGSARFKGNYDGTTSAAFFNGVAVDEIYLIQAECEARLGDKDRALETLNRLLIMRFENDKFTPVTAASDTAALRLILAERRKELPFRGLRWSDLRRLNQDGAFALALTREIEGEISVLPPNDLRYVLLIPQQQIHNSGIAQNAR